MPKIASFAVGSTKGFNPSGVFNPIQLSSLHSWYDASDTSTISATSNNITQWRDKSANGRHMTTSAGQPKTNTVSRNGKNVVFFDGTSYLKATASVTSNALTVFVVGNKTDSPTGATTYSRLLSLYGSSNDYDNTDAILMHMSAVSFNGVTPPLVGCYRNSNPIGSIAWGLNTPAIATMSLNGSSVSFTANASTVSGSTSSTSLNATGNTLGAGGPSGGGDQYMYGWIAEQIIYNRVLSAGEIASVQSYLKAKWGFTY